VQFKDQIATEEPPIRAINLDDLFPDAGGELFIRPENRASRGIGPWNFGEAGRGSSGTDQVNCGNDGDPRFHKMRLEAIS
jgi:hypothetical protein